MIPSTEANRTASAYVSQAKILSGSISSIQHSGDSRSRSWISPVLLFNINCFLLNGASLRRIYLSPFRLSFPVIKFRSAFIIQLWSAAVNAARVHYCSHSNATLQYVLRRVFAMVSMLFQKKAGKNFLLYVKLL